jgi:hypothetical protein
MSVGVFTDKKHAPGAEEISAAMAGNSAVWGDLVNFLRTNYSVEETWKFMYGKKYGWALHVERDKKMLANLYPTQGGFTVQINLPESSIREALALDLPTHIRQAIEGAFPFPEGRWTFLPCRSDRDLPVIQQLLELRVRSRLDKKAK